MKKLAFAFFALASRYNVGRSLRNHGIRKQTLGRSDFLRHSRPVSEEIECREPNFPKSAKLAPIWVLIPSFCMVFRADSESDGLEAQILSLGRVFAKSAKLAPFEVLMPFLCRVFRAEYENGSLEGRIPRRIKKNFETLATPENFLKSGEK